ncbi:MAG: hypothetical protein U1C13_18510 [Pseudomonas sp.]|nr:hypothetical protein [Pseudomonas sp.]
MKNPDIEDLIIMLVSAGWSKRGIVEVIMRASTMDPYHLEEEIGEITYKIGELRKFSSRKESYNNLGYRAYSKKIVPDASGSSDLYLKVKDMLVLDLGLSNDQIVSLISERLGGEEYLPPLSKKSLANWLDRLTAYYSPSEILHAAAVIRDRFHKGQPLDWGVRGES